MPIAEIITIGTELLLGEILDTNTRYLARALRDAGIDLYRTSTVGDNLIRIAQCIQESMERADIIITTGGLGPTVDDPTRQAIAKAVGQELEFKPELWEQIQSRFQRWGRSPGENNKRQAFIPVGAIAIENPVGTAPAFIVETMRNAIICLPGVPTEMEVLLSSRVLPYLAHKFHLSAVIKSLVIHTAGIGESTIDELIGDLELQSNPTVGLAAHSGQVDVRITVKAGSQIEADQLILKTRKIVEDRLTDAIYGENECTLEDVIGDLLTRSGLKLQINAVGLGKTFLDRLQGKAWCENITLETQNPTIFQKFKAQPHLVQAVVVLNPQNSQLDVKISWNGNVRQFSRSYAGPPQNAPIWASNYALDYLRRFLLSIHTTS